MSVTLINDLPLDVLQFALCYSYRSNNDCWDWDKTEESVRALPCVCKLWSDLLPKDKALPFPEASVVKGRKNISMLTKFKIVSTIALTLECSQKVVGTVKTWENDLSNLENLTNIPYLRHLYLYNLSEDSLGSIVTILNKLDNLETLYLSWRSHQSMASIKLNLPNLRSFVMENSDFSVNHVLNNSPLIESFFVTRGVTSSELQAMTRKLPNLKVLGSLKGVKDIKNFKSLQTVVVEESSKSSYSLNGATVLTSYDFPNFDNFKPVFNYTRRRDI
eukprot:TRINITY_DN2702_c0_g1_i1.p1 TRINITY_DN2702_c0_g1~~TRINITY_DN2702_c0_g1_i1.p1  ORF type:complete len:275 (+),score=25.66 TRINITY_DN2702_c0_g1_i1:168-992(+)